MSAERLIEEKVREDVKAELEKKGIMPLYDGWSVLGIEDATPD